VFKGIERETAVGTGSRIAKAIGDTGVSELMDSNGDNQGQKGKKREHVL
jgi:hypothetical protein